MHWQVLVSVLITVLNLILVFSDQFEFAELVGKWVFATLSIFSYLFGIGVGFIYALV